MKTLIILKGLSKQAKLDWIKENEFELFFLDVTDFRKYYSSPELMKSNEYKLTRSEESTVIHEFLRVLIQKLSKGSLVVIDLDNFGVASVNTLAMIFGYTVFYKVFDIPQDYIGKPQKYSEAEFPKKTREQLEEEVKRFLNLQFQGKKLIDKRDDIFMYWEKEYPIVEIPSDVEILHVSDLHSHQPEIPKDFTGLVVFMGDYIDGPIPGGSKEIITKVLNESMRTNPKQSFIFLEGNHELRLRKYLGAKLIENDIIKDILLYNLSSEFRNSTEKEFINCNPKEILEGMNRKLRTHVIIERGPNTYICTHAGIRDTSQLNAQIIGNVIYGNRDINRYDQEFSQKMKNTQIWSIHAHCKYWDKWEVLRHPRAINLDPETLNDVIYLLNTPNHKTWRIWKKEE